MTHPAQARAAMPRRRKHLLAELASRDAVIREQRVTIGELTHARSKAEAEAGRLQRLADEYAQRIRAAEHEAEQARAHLTAAEQATEELARQFPSCPACGCRTPDEPDQRECGCDAGCNDGEHAPGINVLLADLSAELVAARADADRTRDEKSEGDRALMSVVAERDRLRDTLAAMTRPAVDAMPAPGVDGYPPDLCDGKPLAAPGGDAAPPPLPRRRRKTAGGNS